MKSAYPYIHRHPTTGVTELDNGMTLRDWFAGQALAGLLANPETKPDSNIIVAAAYRLANEMIEMRENKHE